MALTTLHQTQIEGHSTKYPSLLFKTVKVVKNEGRLKNCHRSGETKDTWQLNVMWYLEEDPGREKEH